MTKFDIIEKDGAVYIKGEESSVKNGRRKPNVKCSAQGKDNVVIVGGLESPSSQEDVSADQVNSHSGSGTFGAVQQLRESGYKGLITMVGNEGNLPLDRTKLSKALIPNAEKLLWRNKEWYSEASVELISDTVTSIDFSKKSVKRESGPEIPYTKLVLATGGTPKRLPLPGFKELNNIFVLRRVPDVQDILAAVGDKGKKIAIVGSSFIGMEVANALSKENTVTIIGMEKAPLERVMGEEVGKIFQKILEKNGVKFCMGASVDSATPSEKDPKSVGAVKLKDGASIEADLVILGVGVAPATQYLKDNESVNLEKDGSLRVDENFKVEGLEDVFAIGDIATYPYHGPGGNGTPTRIEHWSKSRSIISSFTSSTIPFPFTLGLPSPFQFNPNTLTYPTPSQNPTQALTNDLSPPITDVAQNAGRSVAHTIAKPTADKPKSFIPIFWSALGSQLRYCGNTPNGWDSLVLKGEPENGKFAAYYAKGDEVVAVASMMMDPIMSKCSELMLRGRMPSKGDLERGVNPLEVDLVA